MIPPVSVRTRLPDTFAVLRWSVTMALMVLLMATAPAQERPACCIFPYRCPTAARLSPQVGQRGTRVTLLLQGARLEQIEDVLFYGPGLKYVSFAPVDQVPDDNSQQQKSTPPGTAAALTLDIAGDCPLESTCCGSAPVTSFPKWSRSG